ncbi:MAG: hypothetical protein AAFP84_13955 [Actinomycetota bacterium]
MLVQRRAVQDQPGDPTASQNDRAHTDRSFGLFAPLHGVVTLEINHHLPRGGESARFDRIIRAELASLTR